jgi:hypothetical protein
MRDEVLVPEPHEAARDDAAHPPRRPSLDVAAARCDDPWCGQEVPHWHAAVEAAAEPW